MSEDRILEMKDGIGGLKEGLRRMVISIST